MHRPGRFLLPLLALLWLAGCSRVPDTHTDQLLAMGTLVDVTLVAKNPAALAALTQGFNRLEHTWHPWRKGSQLHTINLALRATGTATIPPPMRPLIQRSMALARATGDRFNPAIGALVKAWGFDQGIPDPPRPPSKAQLAAARQQIAAFSTLSFSATDGQLNTPVGIQLDFGAIAKGLAVQQAIKTLEKRGIHNAIVNAGGDLQVLGSRGERAWQIGIRAPRGNGLLATVAAHDHESLFTSGDYERYYQYQGRRYHHLLDPATGQPARGMRSVTVLTEDPILADAASTALFIAGPRHWQTVAHALGVRLLLWVDGLGQLHQTRSMAARSHMQDPSRKVQLHDDP